MRHIRSFINLTPHAIRIYSHDGSAFVDLPPSGTVARVSVREEETAEGSVSCSTGTAARTHLEFGETTGWQAPVIFTSYGEVEGLPEELSTPVLVSGLVLEALHGTGREAYAPDTGPTAVRGPDGQIIGVRRLKKARP